jgi:polyphenol oxidase
VLGARVWGLVRKVYLRKRTRMFERVTAGNGVVFYRSGLLAGVGVPHGFSTRIGGVSGAPFESLNFAMHPVGPLPDGSRATVVDSRENVMENYRRLQEAIGGAGRAPTWSEQVHGRDVCIAPVKEGEKPKVDAIVTRDGGVMATIRVADCMPVLLSDDRGSVVAAVHAGWRGAVLGVIGVALETMGVGSGRVVAAVGPCIGVDAFEVGEEVAAEFEKAGRGGAVVRRAGWVKPHVDLAKSAVLELESLGVSRDRIDVAGACTVADGAFFSHRRDRGLTGRMVAMIGVGGGVA